MINTKKKILILGGNGFIGNVIRKKLEKNYSVIITSGHHEVDGGYTLDVENIDGLNDILNNEKPNIIISSLRGDFDKQLVFHEKLADWVNEHEKKLIYISTLNVFDADNSRAWTEDDAPVPESDYGKCKAACEEIVRNRIKEGLVIIRIPMVWGYECPRIKQLREYEMTGKRIHTYRGLKMNMTSVGKIAEYLEFIILNNLQGIFHVGSTDLVDYFEFQKMVCDKLKMNYPMFDIDDVSEPLIQACIPEKRKEVQVLNFSYNDVLNEIVQ